MDFIFQITLTIFIIFSFIMLLVVPYFCSVKNIWDNNKFYVLLGSTIWFLFVFVLGVLNSLVS